MKRPSCPAGDICPRPVAYTRIAEPADAGLPGELSEPSSLRASACPLPEPSREKIPGVTGETGSAKACDVWPWYSTWICVVADCRPKGTAALT
jgi:hypothetical protein